MIEQIVLQNKITKERIPIDKTTTHDYVLGEVDFGQVGSKSSTYKYVNQVGYDKDATMLETRNVDIQGWIIANDDVEMKNRKYKLNNFVNPLQDLIIYYKGYVLSFTPSSSIKYGVGYEENNNTIVNFKISGTAYDPCFYDEVESSKSAGDADGMFRFPMIITDKLVPETVIFGVRRSDSFIYINSKSSIDAGVIIRLKAEGSVVNPQIINVKTGEIFKLNKTLLDEIVEINTEIGNRSIISTKLDHIIENYFKYKTYESVWPKLVLGENIFAYQAESLVQNLKVYIIYKNKYLEVQEWN